MSNKFEALDATTFEMVVANVVEILEALHGVDALAVAVTHASRQTACQSWWMQVAEKLRPD